MSIRTLVVDDDAHVAAVHAAFVERTTGFVVAGVAHRGTEALQAIAAGGIDLVLLDLYLPDVHGLEVCRRLQAGDAARPDVIAVTAARDVATVHRAVGHGVVQYLVKPFSYATFRSLVSLSDRTRFHCLGVRRTAREAPRGRATGGSGGPQ